MSTPEAGLRERVLHQIRLDYPPRRSGVLIFGRPASGATGAGHPDLFGVVLGRYIGLELKMPGAKPTPVQIQRIKDLRECGACAWVVRSPLEATRAIYQTKQGVRVMADEPIDFDDWLKGLDLNAQSTEAVEAQVVDTPAIETAALEAGLSVEQADGPEPDFEPLPDGPGQDNASDVLEVMLASDAQVGEPLARKPDLNDVAAMVKANEALATVELPAPPKLKSIQQEADEDQAHATLQEDIRTVGDRVTLLYEREAQLYGLCAALLHEVLIMREQFNTMLREIDVAHAVVAIETPEPTPLDDLLPPEQTAPPSVAEGIKRRRRKAS